MRHHLRQIVDRAEGDEVHERTEYLAHKFPEPTGIVDIAFQEAPDRRDGLGDRIRRASVPAFHENLAGVVGDMRHGHEIFLSDSPRDGARGVFAAAEFAHVRLDVGDKARGDLELLLGAQNTGEVGGEGDGGHDKRHDEGELEHHTRPSAPYPPLQQSQHVAFAFHLNLSTFQPFNLNDILSRPRPCR